MRIAVSRIALAALLLLGMGFEWEGRLSRLERELDGSDPARRREVVRLLASYPPEQVREPLLQALSDPDAGVRAEAAEAVGRVRLREAVPRLLDWLDDPDADVRASAARALGRIAARRSVGPLVRALGDANAEVRAAAIEALAAIGTPAVIVPLLGRLDDSDADVRRDAAEALGRLGDERAVVPLIGRARDGSPEVRLAVYSALGELGDERGVPALLQGLRDEQLEPRLAAIAALGRVGSSTAVDPLVTLLGEPDHRTARAAVAALGAIGTDRALDAVIGALAHQGTREAAAEVLVDTARRRRVLEGERTAGLVERLARALSRTSNDLHATAIAQVLYDLAAVQSTEPAAAALLEALRAERGAVASVMKALAATADHRALVPLLERLLSPAEAIHGAALDAIRVYFDRREPDGRAADPLLTALGRVAPEHRVEVVRLLGRVRAARALPTLRPLLEHSDPELRLAAIEAIGAIGDSQGAATLLELLEERDARTRFEAARALQSAATAETAGALVERIGRTEPFDRHAGLVALGGALARLRADDALPAKLAGRARTLLLATVQGEDLELAARALDALAHWGDPDAVPPLLELLDTLPAPLARQATFALGAFEGEPARRALRARLGADEAPIRAAAAAALGEHGQAEDAERLLERAADDHWPVPAAATFSIARLARRGELEVTAVHDALCGLASARDPYVRANVSTAMAALEAPPCPEGPEPLDWLDARHSSAVRVAAVRWLAASARAEARPAAPVREALERCVDADLAPDVVEVCRDPSMPPMEQQADVYAYASDGRTTLADRIVALRLADGSVLVARTDLNAHLRLANAPRGELVLDDPVSTPLEP